MKKFICFIAFAGLLSGATVVANAQSKKASQATITFVNGKVMVVKDGKQTPLAKDVLMADGRMFKPDGSIVNADGTLSQMTNGQTVDLKPYVMEKAAATPAKKK